MSDRELCISVSPPPRPRLPIGRRPIEPSQYLAKSMAHVGESKDPYKGYMDAAGVGLDPPLDTNRPTPSLWNESMISSVDGSVVGSDFPSEGTSAFRYNFREELGPPIPLLKFSSTRAETSDRYSVLLRRASLRQRYGVAFEAAETHDRRLRAFTIAEDLPHLGISKGDLVVSVNKSTPKSVEECREALERAMVIELVLQRRPSSPRLRCKEPAGGMLLSVTKAAILDEGLGEFRLTMRRSSQKQRFGLVFEPLPPKRKGDELVIIIAADMPHLALERGDRLMSLNGRRIRSKRLCSQILSTAMTISLIIRREHGDVLSLAHDVVPLDDLEVPYASAGPCLLNCMGCFIDEPETPRTMHRSTVEKQVVAFDAMGGAMDEGEDACFPTCVQRQEGVIEHIDNRLPTR